MLPGVGQRAGLQADRERHQVLLDAVVDVAFEAAAAARLGGDDALPAGPQVLEPGGELIGQDDTLQRRTGLGGQIREQAAVRGRQWTIGRGLHGDVTDRATEVVHGYDDQVLLVAVHRKPDHRARHGADPGGRDAQPEGERPGRTRQDIRQRPGLGELMRQRGEGFVRRRPHAQDEPLAARPIRSFTGRTAPRPGRWRGSTAAARATKRGRRP